MSVQKTRIAEFEVVDIQTTHIWIKLKESRDAGMRFAVPIEHQNHDGNITEVLKKVNIGTELQLSLGEKDHNEGEVHIERLENVNRFEN